ncbi:rRNA maturation RNase YbeY [Kordiimonas aquimaris]|uniref:rRNA maturation RNase YbeY n=1 Tax=Kordiimonas aquimaris TaxID=707591 RepID=UPI0021CFE6CA|nr:rRNA maturation RNase YbeY [Kordiimonas aquimaris]
MPNPLGALAPSDDPSSSITGLGITAEAEHLNIDIDIEDHGLGKAETVEAVLRLATTHAVTACVNGNLPPAELYVRVVNADDSQQLNGEYRGKDKPTNVLSFPAIEPDFIDIAIEQALADGPPVMLGDIIIAAPVIIEEAKTQKKHVNDHLAHMVVHGVLHLFGHDHINDQDAQIMEDLERNILSGIGIADPYQEEFTDDR